MFYKIISTTGNEPISLVDVKAALKIDTNVIDVRLQGLIQAARSYIETLTGRALVNKTIQVEIHPVNPREHKLVNLDTSGEIYLTIPLQPLLKVESIYCEGKEVTGYRVEENQKIFLPTRCLNHNLVMTLRVGYADEDFPAVLKEAVMMTVQSLYEKGEFPLEESLLKIVQSFRVMNLH